jgi:hypothetical protein
MKLEYWAVTKDRKRITFRTRKEAAEWQKMMKVKEPKGNYHIFDNNPDGYISKNRGKSWRTDRRHTI